MAVLETNAGGALLDVTSPLTISNYPFTFACWVRRTGNPGAARVAMALGNSAGAQNYYKLRHNTFYFPQITSRYNNTAEDLLADATQTIGTNVWVPMVAVWTASNDRLLHRGGQSAVTDTTDDIGGFTGSTNSINSSTGRFALGRDPDVADYFQGKIAHAAAWNKTLSSAEIASFLAGGNPLAIASANLLGYWAESFFQDTDWYYQDESGNGYHLLLESGAVRDAATTGPTVDAPPATEQPGITITGIKEPNIADQMVDGVTNARVKVWYGTDDTGAEADLLPDVAITGGTLSTGLNGSPEIAAALTVEVMWTVGTERKLLVTDTTVVDLGV